MRLSLAAFTVCFGRSAARTVAPTFLPHGQEIPVIGSFRALRATQYTGYSDVIGDDGWTPAARQRLLRAVLVISTAARGYKESFIENHAEDFTQREPLQWVTIVKTKFGLYGTRCSEGLNLMPRCKSHFMGKHSRLCCHFAELAHCCNLFLIITPEVFLYVGEQSSEQPPSHYHQHRLQGALVVMWRQWGHYYAQSQTLFMYGSLVQFH